jgi:hypothetical protein
MPTATPTYTSTPTATHTVTSTPTNTLTSTPMIPPSVNAGGPYAVNEGGSLTLTASGSDPGHSPLTYLWDLDNNGTFETSGQSVTFSASSYDGPGNRIITVKATNSSGLYATAQATVAVDNVAPAIGTINAPLDPNQVTTSITTSADFSDEGILDTHIAVWDWGDGSTSNGIINEINGAGSASGTHVYTGAGVYTLKLTVTDDDGGTGTSMFQFVVIYDPGAGFVTGGGWINSPAGACKLTTVCEGATGKANFGFVAKYEKGANIPSGQTEFNFKAGKLNFKSTEYQWLVVAGAKAQYKGYGTINGSGEYGFMLKAIDGQINGGGGVDKFRIKIWDRATGEVVYDNQMGAAEDADPSTAIGGGSIVIHK